MPFSSAFWSAGADGTTAAGGVAADLLLDDATLAALHVGEPVAAWRWEALGTDVQDFLAGKVALDVTGRFVARVEAATCD